VCIFGEWHTVSKFADLRLPLGAAPFDCGLGKGAVREFGSWLVVDVRSENSVGRVQVVQLIQSFSCNL
jgi:hypothetical protein